MDIAVRLVLRVLKWLIGQFLHGGHNPTGSLPGGVRLPSVPPPSNDKAKAKAKALTVENEVLRADAKVDHAGRTETLQHEAEVTDETGRVTGLHFGPKP